MPVLDILRTEQKYPIRLDTAQALSNQLSLLMERDPYTGASGSYPVRSLYFDSFYNRDFYEKSAGLECRKKLRLRTYGPEYSIAKLEWKQKQGSVQRKRSLLLSLEEAELMAQGDYRCLLNRPEPLALEFYTQMTTQVYRPCCIVEYNRTAFVEKTNDTRITLDRDLRVHEGNSNLFSPHFLPYPATTPNQLTLEIKYNTFLLSYIKDVLSRYTSQQSAMSKYCAGRKYGLGGTML